MACCPQFNCSQGREVKKTFILSGRDQPDRHRTEANAGHFSLTIKSSEVGWKKEEMWSQEGERKKEKGLYK